MYNLRATQFIWVFQSDHPDSFEQAPSRIFIHNLIFLLKIVVVSESLARRVTPSLDKYCN